MKAEAPNRYACEVVWAADFKSAYAVLVEDATGAYVRPRDLGFTHEDVKSLRAAAFSVNHLGLHEIADRIEALLPPESE